MSYNYEREEQVQKFKGRPKDHTKKNLSAWQKFIKHIAPWIQKKWDLGNAYLEAKVEKEKNEAEKIKAETNLINLKAEREAREIAEMASRIDEKQAAKGELKILTGDELEARLTEFAEMVKMLNIKYGFKISINIEHANPSLLATYEDIKMMEASHLDSEDKQDI